MTTRLPDEPMRVTNWLAGWVDYVFAIALVAGRWLRLPVSEPEQAPGFRSAFAPTVPESFAPRWHAGAAGPKSGPLVKIAEIAMLSVSFFLAAHLLSGGTPTAVAPNLNPLNLLAEHDRARTTVVASPRVEISVPAASMVLTFGDRVLEVSSQDSEVAAILPLPSDTGALAAAGTDSAIAVLPESAPRAEETAPPPPPAPAAVAPKPIALPEPAGRYLTTDELRTAALAAGWPANLLDDVVSVARCESTFYTHAHYYGALGLMQMMPLWFGPAGLDAEMWADPVTNLRAARFAYLENELKYGDAWGPWTCKPNHTLTAPS